MTKFYTKSNVSLHEYNMQKHIYNLGILNVPKIISYDEIKKIMIMEKIEALNISDFYGEEPFNIDNSLFDKIRTIIKTLYENNIIYPDITGYNFIQDENDIIWIIDFEHAKFRFYKDENNFEHEYTDNFVYKFINGLNEWNPEFK